MYFVNKETVLIDGWLVNQDLSCLIEPSTLVDEGIVTRQRFEELIDRGLKNWDLLFIPESDLYCEDSEELFQYITTQSHIFCELSDGSIKNTDCTEKENLANEVLRRFSLVCHSATMADGRDIYIHQHTCTRNNVKKCLNTDLVLQSKYYTAIAFNDRSYFDLEGFLIDLESHEVCSLFSPDFQTRISAPIWLGLRSVSSASMFERVRTSSLNYWLTDCKTIFYFMHQDVYVNFYEKEPNRYVCQICERENATNVALPVPVMLDGTRVVKFIVLSQKIQDHGPTLQDLKRPWEKESFSMDANLHRHYALMERNFFDPDEHVEVPDIIYIQAREIWQLPFKAKQDILKPKLYHFGVQKHVQDVHSMLLKRMLQQGQWKIENIKNLMKYDSELKSLLGPVLPEYEKLHEERICAILKTGLGSFVERICNKVKNKDGVVLPNIKIIERFLVDIKERVVVSPKNTKYNFEDKIMSKYNLLDWNILILKQQPIEIFSSKLFDSVQADNVQGVDTKLNGRRYITLAFGKFGTVYLYEGKDTEQTYLIEPLSTDNVGSSKFQFYVSELNGLLDVSKHLLHFDSLLKTVYEFSFRNGAD